MTSLKFCSDPKQEHQREQLYVALVVYRLLVGDGLRKAFNDFYLPESLGNAEEVVYWLCPGEKSERFKEPS